MLFLFIKLIFNLDKVKLQRDMFLMFLYIVGTRKITIQSTQDVIDLFKSDSSLENILTDVHKILEIILTSTA